MARPTLDPALQSLLERALRRGRTSMSTRVERVRDRSWQIGQCAIAAGAAWFLATSVFGHQDPFFAPIAALLGLGTSYGQRLRRVAEVTVGMAIGILLGDLLTHFWGSGPWQVAAIVALAMGSALLLDAGILFVNQAAVQGIVVTTLLPDPGAAFTRWTDALIGGSVALVAATVVTRAPLRQPREKAGVVVDKIASLLRAAAESVEDGDVDRAIDVLAEARETDTLIRELRDAADEGLSVVRSSPFRLRHKSGLRDLVELVEPLDFALRNTRVLVRRVAVACYRRSSVPPGYATLLRDLAQNADLVAVELRANRTPDAAIDPLRTLARDTAQLKTNHDLTATTILAQARSIIADLLAVAGLDPFEATDALPPLREP